VINERKQFCVFVERRPAVQEVCGSGDVLRVGVHEVLVVCCAAGFRRVVAIIQSKSFSGCVFNRRSGKGCRFNGSRS
jgi:hypothetical protein